MFNVLGARTLSASGRQLFLIDKFRDTNRPLLAVLADPGSIFISGLRKFNRRALYANILNDKTAVYYTTGISKTDPFTDLEKVKVNYQKGYEGVILDGPNAFTVLSKVSEPMTFASLSRTVADGARRAPWMIFFTAMIPVGISFFLVNSVFKTVQSSHRMKLHEAGKGGVDISGYRVPLLFKEIKSEVEHAYETMNASQGQEYLATGDDDEGLDSQQRQTMARERRMSLAQQPTLALSPYQFDMINGLDTLKWRKHPVYLHNDRHTHAGIIVRYEKKTFDEGWVVLRHFINEEFLM